MLRRLLANLSPKAFSTWRSMKILLKWWERTFTLRISITLFHGIFPTKRDHKFPHDRMLSYERRLLSRGNIIFLQKLRRLQFLFRAAKRRCDKDVAEDFIQIIKCNKILVVLLEILSSSLIIIPWIHGFGIQARSSLYRYLEINSLVSFFNPW